MSDTDPGKAAFEAVMSLLQTVTMRIMELPKEKRDAAIELARRDCMDALAKFNIDTERKRMLTGTMVDAVRAVIAEIEASGGATGRKAE